MSAAAPSKAVPKAELSAWLDEHSAELYLSVVTIAEIEDGIAKSRRLGATRKADQVAEWLELVLHLYSKRVLGLGQEEARLLGRLSGHARALGHAPGLADLAIAATAQRWGYTILTRNLRHFDVLGVAASDPFIRLPA